MCPNTRCMYAHGLEELEYYNKRREEKQAEEQAKRQKKAEGKKMRDDKEKVSCSAKNRNYICIIFRF